MDSIIYGLWSFLNGLKAPLVLTVVDFRTGFLSVVMSSLSVSMTVGHNTPNTGRINNVR